MSGLGLLFKTICKGKNIEEILLKSQSFKACKESVNSMTNSILESSTIDMRSRLATRLNDPELFRLKDYPMNFYTYIRDKLYANIRGGSKLIYESREGYNPKEFFEALHRKANGFHLADTEGAWFFRHPDNLVKKPIVERISLNVYQDKELIEKLDKYLYRNCPNAHYKCPGAGKIGWNTRHDTLTIYFSESVSQKTKQEIAHLAKPHIRNNSNAKMLGEKIDDGVYSILEPTKETIKPLLIKAKLMNLEPEFYEWLGTPDFYNGGGLFVLQNGRRVVHTSPGAVESLKQMLDMFQQVL